MRRSPRTDSGNGGIASQQAKHSSVSAVDLGLALSVYGKDKDGSLFEIGDTTSPLAQQSAAGTWPTEQ
ncbi:hypothetical protein [Novosphingobium sp. 9U]|uniref:hypothetical protein n=1 Tax=Novosphingobium sp. 9U TaxID=2653158 RepID=UPI001356F55D|nr:hypothetical protein [Novosphingobium sp. 9U]